MSVWYSPIHDELVIIHTVKKFLISMKLGKLDSGIWLVLTSHWVRIGKFD